jgi:hypothetical protein
MGIYSPLENRLEQALENAVPMNFSEIESVLGFSLPSSARKRQEWWSNNAKGHSQAVAWLRAGFRTSKVSLKSEQVTFLRQKDVAQPPITPKRHPIFGCMKGMITVEDGYDLTQPTAPDWGRLDD